MNQLFKHTIKTNFIFWVAEQNFAQFLSFRLFEHQFLCWLVIWVLLCCILLILLNYKYFWKVIVNFSTSIETCSWKNLSDKLGFRISWWYNYTFIWISSGIYPKTILSNIRKLYWAMYCFFLFYVLYKLIYFKNVAFV